MRHRTSSPFVPHRNASDPEERFDAISTKKGRDKVRRNIVCLVIFVLATVAVGWTILSTPNHAPVNKSTSLSGIPLDGTLPSDNPTLLSNNMTKLWFSANEMRFELPTDINWVRRYEGIAGSYPDAPFYMRDPKEIEERGKKGSCTGVLDVLAWLMGEVNGNTRYGGRNKGTLMLAYGELIHMHREKEFVDNNGQFFDDDIDTWASLETMSHIAALEPELFRRFGWTVRPIVTKPEFVRKFGWPIRAAVAQGQFVVLAQMIASCGHTIVTGITGKINSTQPAIDIYPIVTISDEEREHSIVQDLLHLFQRKKTTPDGEIKRNIVKDLWQGNQFSESLFFPAKNMTFISSGTHLPLQLQLPNQPTRLMECLYGNWKVPSSKHAGEALDCLNG